MCTYTGVLFIFQCNNKELEIAMTNFAFQGGEHECNHFFERNEYCDAILNQVSLKYLNLFKYVSY